MTDHSHYPGAAAPDPRTDDRLGSVEVSGDTTRLGYERLLRHHPDRVWQAMTTSEEMREWLPCDLVGELTPGSEVDAVFWPDVAERHGLDPATFPCRIIACEPGRVLEWVWGEEVVRFELEETDEGHTLLRLRVSCGPGTEPATELVAAGYHTWMTALVEHLHGLPHPRFVDRETGPLEAAYRAALSGGA